MSKLKAIDPKTARPGKAKVLVFGPPGVGKTFASLDFPVPYFMDTEGGATQDEYTDKLKRAKGVYFGPNEGSQDFKIVMDQVKALGSEKHPYRTLIIDSISKLFNDTIAREADRIEDAGKKDEFGSSKKPAVSYMRKLVSWLQRIDLNVILTAHDKAEWGVGSNGERTEIGRTYDAWDRLAFELDLVLHVYKQGPTRKARVVKSRLKGFPDGAVFDWSYSEFAKRFGEEAINRDVEQLELPTEEELTTLEGLMARAKVSQDKKDEWLKKSGVSAFEDMEAGQLRDLIGKLTDLLNKPAQ